MNRKALLGCPIPVVLVGALAWMGWRAIGRTDPPVLHLAAVDRGDVAIKVTESGTIEALKKLEVKSKVAGRVSRLYVDEGDRVRAGQALAEIDPIEINSQVAQIQAQLDGARARYQQSIRGVSYQKDQTIAGVRQQEEALRAAAAHLRAAEEEQASQPRLSASEIAQAEAGLKTAEDALTLLTNSTHPQAVVNAESGFDEAKAAAESAQRNLERQQHLLDKGFVSQQVVDGARSDLAGANARRDQARKRLDLIAEQNRLEVAGANSRVKDAQAALERAKANQNLVTIKRQETLSAAAAVDQARAALSLARSSAQQDKMRQDDVLAAQAGVTQLENQLREVQVHQTDTHLIAGMDGVVTRRYIEQGELVTSGVSTFSSGTPVLQIADLSRMLVKISVNEVDVHKLRVGLPVEINIDGAKGALFLGRISKVAPAAIGAATGADQSQPATGGSQGVIRFAVEVVVDHPDYRLKPGMSARCSIIIDRRKNVLRLPVDCVEGDGDRATVQIGSTTMKDGAPVETFHAKHLTAGLRGDSHVEVVSGLKAGEKVKPGIFKGPSRKAIDMEMH
jgi:HlyD family secretion protein